MTWITVIAEKYLLSLFLFVKQRVRRDLRNFKVSFTVIEQAVKGRVGIRNNMLCLMPQHFFKIPVPRLFLKIIFICYWLHWVFISMHMLSLVMAQEDYCSLLFMGLSLWQLLFLQGMGSRAPQVRCMDLLALWYVESSWTKDQTHVPCIGSGFLTTGPPGKSPVSRF